MSAKKLVQAENDRNLFGIRTFNPWPDDSWFDAPVKATLPGPKAVRGKKHRVEPTSLNNSQIQTFYFPEQDH